MAESMHSKDDSMVPQEGGIEPSCDATRMEDNDNCLPYADLENLTVPEKALENETNEPEEAVTEADDPDQQADAIYGKLDVPSREGTGEVSKEDAMAESIHFTDDSMSGIEPNCDAMSMSAFRRQLSFSSLEYLTDNFLTPVDGNEFAREPQSMLHRIANSWACENVCSFFILCNCATMGMHAHHSVSHNMVRGTLFFLGVSEHVFTAFFLAEFLFRLKVHGRQYYWPITCSDRRANFVDATLVILTGVVVTWVVPLFFLIVHNDGNEPCLRTLTLLRAVRIIRLVRVFRKVPLFREAWQLIRGLQDSMRTLGWTIVVIFFVTYAFGIAGLLLITVPLQSARMGVTDGAELEQLDAVIDVLDGIDKIMYTLVQVLCQDSFHAYMREVLVYVPFSWLYFYAYIALACLVLMNLVTAIIVENAMDSSRNDHEQQMQEKTVRQKGEMQELRKLFTLMDADGSGTLCWDEFKDSFEDHKMAQKWMLLDFGPDECRQLFALLDDGHGEIETSEFFEGLSRMKGSAQSKDVYRLQKTMNKLVISLEEANVIQQYVSKGLQSGSGA